MDTVPGHFEPFDVLGSIVAVGTHKQVEAVAKHQRILQTLYTGQKPNIKLSDNDTHRFRMKIIYIYDMIGRDILKFIHPMKIIYIYDMIGRDILKFIHPMKIIYIYDMIGRDILKFIHPMKIIYIYDMIGRDILKFIHPMKIIYIYDMIGRDILKFIHPMKIIFPLVNYRTEVS